MTNPATQIFLGTPTPEYVGKYYRPEFYGKQLKWLELIAASVTDPSLVVTGTPSKIFAVAIKGTTVGQLYYFKTNLAGDEIEGSGILDAGLTNFKPIVRLDEDGNLHCLYHKGSDIAWIKYDTDFNVLDSDTSLLTIGGAYKLDFEWLGSNFKLVVSHSTGIAAYTMTKAGVTAAQWTLVDHEDAAVAVDIASSKVYVTSIDRNSNPYEQNTLNVRRYDSSFSPETNTYTKKKFAGATGYYFLDTYFKEDHLIIVWEQTPDVDDKISVGFYYIPESLYYEWDGWINEDNACAKPTISFDPDNNRLLIAGDIAGSSYGFLYIVNLIQLYQNMMDSVKIGYYKVEITPIGGSADDVSDDVLEGSVQLSITDRAGSASFNLLDVDAANGYATKYKKGDQVDIILGRTQALSELKFGGVIADISGTLDGKIQIIRIDADDFSAVCHDKQVAEAFDETDTSPAHSGYPSEIFKHLVTTKLSGFTTNGVKDSESVIEYIAWNYSRLFECLKELAEFAGYEWYVDKDKDFHFFSPTVTKDNAVFITTKVPLANIKRGTADFQQDFSGIKNRIFLLGGKNLTLTKRKFYFVSIGKDDEEPYPLPYVPYYNPEKLTDGKFPSNGDIQVRVNGGSPVDVAIEGSPEGDVEGTPTVDCLINPKEKTLRFVQNFPTIGQEVEVKYKFYYPIIDRLDDIGSQEYFGGGIGGDQNLAIREDVLILPDVDDRKILRKKGRAVLKRRAFPLWVGVCQLYEDRLYPGKAYKVEIPEKEIDLWMKAVEVTHSFSRSYYRTTLALEEVKKDWET